MAFRWKIQQVSTTNRDWTCKVQVVEKGRERLSPERKIQFQNLLMEDEEGQQVKGVLYGKTIKHFADRLHLYHTYFITAAQVKSSSSLPGRQPHSSYWLLDMETTISEENKSPFPAPTKLCTTPIERIIQMGHHPTSDLDILAVVINSGPPKYVGRQSTRCQELTIMDNQENQLMLTLWDDYSEVEGTKLQTQIEAAIEGTNEYPVIIARNIATSSFRGISLQTKFYSIIHIGEIGIGYPQVTELIMWAQSNKQLIRTKLQDTSSSVTVTTRITPPNPLQQTIISIADIQSQSSLQTFQVEAQITLWNDQQKFCVLHCSECKQPIRTTESLESTCNCCTFEIDITDASGTTVTISEQAAEQMLAQTAQEIFELTCVKKQLLPISQVQQQLANKMHYIQLKKLTWKAPESTTNLKVIYLEEKKTPTTMQTQPASSSATTSHQMEA